MENNEVEFIKIKVKSTYGTVVSKYLEVDSNIHDMMQAWREILLALGYSDGNIREYIEPN